RKPMAQVTTCFSCEAQVNNRSRAVFFWYSGSGLVIQCLARFQWVFSRLRARRTLSSEIGTAMMPCSKHAWATSSRRPGSTFFPEFARTAMQQVLQAVQSFFRERGAQAMGTRRSLAQHVETGGIEAMDYIAHHLVVAAHLASDLWHSFSASGGGQHLAAT